MREYIYFLMRKYDLSLTGLADKLKYKSKTSINRIMNGTAKTQSVWKFKQKVLSEFELLPEEKELLTHAVLSAVYGKEKYLTNQAIWDFIKNDERTKGRKADLQISSICSGIITKLETRYVDTTRLQITVLNCQYISGLFEIISGLIQHQNANVEHFIYVDDNDVRTIRAICSLMPVFYETAYMGYARRKRPMDQEQDCGIYESDLMIISWEDNETVSHTDIIVFTDSDKGVLIEVPYLDEMSLKSIGLDRQNYTPIKRNYFERNAFMDYIKFSRDYAALEKDHSIWKLKPDVGVDQMPAWILRKAVQEGIIPQDELSLRVLDKLEKVHRERYLNTITKQKNIYTVFKRGAMRRFALTGKTTDHFWMMRPFTPEERIVILSEMLEQQQNNPHVHMYFLKEDDTVRDVEIAYYEGEGILILDSETDYNLEQGHSEVMITQEKMMTLFKEFFLGELLQDYVLPETYTCDFLRHLIFEAEDIMRCSQ